MTRETEELNADLTTAQVFSRLLPDTPQKYPRALQRRRYPARAMRRLRNHLMVRRNYEALVSGDGACAGCGEKSILRACRERHRGLHASALPSQG
jgi:pyruvate-ferredoxin/flavodoxin oxidoreductase